MKVLWIATTLLGAASGYVGAQLPVERCSEVVGVLSSGSIQNSVEQGMAFRDASGCLPESASAYATALRRRKAEQLGPDLTTAFRTAIAHQAVLDEASALALDETASVPVRVLSLGILRMYLNGTNWVPYPSLAWAGLGEQCDVIVGSAQPALVGSLPTNVADAIRSTVASVERVGSVLPLRSAANCVMNEWRRMRQLPTQPLLGQSEYTFALSHECGDVYRAQVVTRFPVSLEYDFDGAAGRKLLIPNLVQPGQPSAETRIVAKSTGPVRLYFDGDVVATATPINGPCP